MFEGFLCDSITVPSCDKHNSKKSGDDQAIVSAFLMPLRNGSERYPLESEVKLAIENARPSFERAKRKAVNAPLLSDLPENLASYPNVAHIAPSANIRTWVRQLTAALVYDAAQVRDSSIKWGEVIAWSPNFIEANEPIPLTYNRAVSMFTKQTEIKAWLEGLQWLDGWSAYPKAYPLAIYSFDLYIQPEEIIFRHRFYRRYTWYVWFSCLPDTSLNLMQRVADEMSGRRQTRGRG
jgi:hypothetical protein